MKQKKGFDFNKFLTILTIVIWFGCGLISTLLLRPIFNAKPSLNTVAIHPDSSKVSQINPGLTSDRFYNKESRQLQEAASSQADLRISEGEEDEFLLDPLESESSTELERAELDNERKEDLKETSGLNLIPEQQEVASIAQRVYSGAEEYREIMTESFELSNGLQTPEIIERRRQIASRIYELDSELPKLAIRYCYLTQDRTPVATGGWIQQLFSDGVMKIELRPPLGGEFISIITTPSRFL